MESSPYLDDDFNKASEFLRLTLTLLGKYKVPPSPCNFRIGYEQVSGRNVALAHEFESLLCGVNEFDTDALWGLYQKHFMHSEASLNKMREELKSILVNVREEIQSTGGSLEGYSATLIQFSEALDQASTVAQMSQEVQKVIDDTQVIQRSQEQMQINMKQMMSEIDTLRQELNQVKQESLTDALTGLANRKAFDKTLENAIAEYESSGQPVSLILLDIDHFKKFNDTYGHLVGDKVIRFVAATMKKHFKGQDLCARYGGEEFAVILPATSIEGARTVAEQVRKAICAKVLKDSSNQSDYGLITASAGVAEYIAGEMPVELIDRADAALYKAKENGRNCVITAAE